MDYPPFVDLPPPPLCLTHTLILKFFQLPALLPTLFSILKIPYSPFVNGGEEGVQTMISKIKLFISKYNWKEMKNSSGKNGWKTFGKNNPTIALIVLYFKNIYPAHISKHNLNHLVGNFDA